ncbi:nudix-type nucleoside diphosphatase, YffH/AdpP family [Chryseobacterium piscicola]|nr:GDP-mannose pyrophosphatase NudK [Chryseobacterium piscicola]SIS90886.1 nudix-type nucleoside diphosphatase, YffH/AdpP family [Chryseobacterium piscicola]
MPEHTINIENTEILSNNWYTLKKVTFQIIKDNGETEVQIREAYDRGNGAAILLYNINSKNVILTRQFRLPTYINGNSTGFLIEACAGVLDNDNPEDCIKRETEEETGYKISKLEKIFEAYMSPGSVTELLHFYIAEYADDMKVNEGGGLKEEGENIEVLEINFEKAIEMIVSGEIKDAKTIMLLQHLLIKNLV